jgi:hypothetical protein
LLTNYATSVGKFLQSKVILEHPEAPEDSRLLHLFQNRAELKKELSGAVEEIHRLKDRIKLQEGATARVREQLEHLEARLAAPVSGLHALLHYQLRDLWSNGHAHVAALVRELAQQTEDRERRQLLAEMNRQIFERQQSARQACAQAEHAAAEARARLAAVHSALAGARGWWQYFTRRELIRRRLVLQSESMTAEALVDHAREQLQQVEAQGGGRYPGLSRDARRMLNLTAIACAQVLALRLTPPVLLSRASQAVSRGEPATEGSSDPAACVAVMLEIARAKAAMTQNATAIHGDVRRLVDQLAAAAHYQSDSDMLPVEESVRTAIKASLARADHASGDVLARDLWSVSDLFYSAGD